MKEDRGVQQVVLTTQRTLVGIYSTGIIDESVTLTLLIRNVAFERTIFFGA